MELELTRLSSKGQIVIPASIREKLFLKEGQTLAVSLQDGLVCLKKINNPLEQDLETINGIKKSWEEIEQGKFKKFSDKKEFLDELTKW